MQIMRIKSGRRSKTCYKRAIFTELQQIKNYTKLIAKGQLSCWNTDKIKLRLELAAVCVHKAWSNFDFY